MPACVALGQAAGLAASILLRKGGAFCDINGEKLHARLVEIGAMKADA